jgi:hypothetical protein
MGVILSRGDEENGEGCDIRIQVDQPHGIAMIEMASAYGEGQIIIEEKNDPQLYTWLLQGEKTLLEAGGRKVDLEIEPR